MWQIATANLPKFTNKYACLTVFLQKQGILDKFSYLEMSQDLVEQAL